VVKAITTAAMAARVPNMSAAVEEDKERESVHWDAFSRLL
jgi:hypothetical protein